jgi:hypothetical protein
MMFRSLGRLMRSWWEADRIRILPSEGRWLRLLPGDLVEHDGKYWEIVDRAVRESPSESLVAYRCVAGSRMRRLLVAPGTFDELEWEEEGVSRPVHAAELTLWPKGVDRW